VFQSAEFAAGFTTGIEGPCCAADGVLYAVNYEREGTIGRVLPDGTADVFVELPEGSVGNGIVLDADGTLLVADYTAHRVLRLGVEDRSVTVVATEPRMHQPNDIAIGPDRRVYASDPDWANDAGQLWRVDRDGSTTLLETGMGTTNGIEVSPDGRRLYVNETVQRRVWCYDLHDDGSVSGKRLLVSFPDFAMDGMRCDVAGNLWIARWGKGTVVRVTPDGVVDKEVRLRTGSDCTNVAFGGPDGCTVHVTVADCGTVEKFRVDVPGRAFTLWAR
jgi:gluconolactonase